MIRTVLLDIDGVLTDGAVYVDADGKETKRILFDDIDAIFEMKRAGLKVGFITGENNRFTDWVRQRFQADYFLSGCKDKLEAFKTELEPRGLTSDTTCFVGDAKRDCALLAYVRHSFAPADVPEQVLQAARYRLKSRRGQGVIREVSDFILNTLPSLTGA